LQSGIRGETSESRVTILTSRRYFNEQKNNLLSIGEMHKLTGVGIKTLRYYEEIKLFQPTYTDPDSGYRYYSLDQVYLLEMIVFCTELNIPLCF